MSSHEGTKENIPAYALGGLDPEEAAELEEHLSGCEICQRELASYGSLREAMSLAAPEASLPEGSRERLLERAGSYGSSGSSEPTGSAEPASPDSPDSSGSNVHTLSGRRRDFRRPSRRTWIAAAAAAVLLVAVGAIGTFALTPLLTGPPLEPVAFSEAPPGVEAEANLVAHTWGTETKLAASGLEEGQNYQVTLLSEDGNPVPSGAFIGTGDELIECNLNAALLRENATALVIRAAADGELVLRADLPENPEVADQGLSLAELSP